MSSLERVLKPADIVRMHEQGFHIDYIAGTVFLSGFYTRKSAALDYVRKCVYKSLMEKKEKDGNGFYLF